MITETQDGLVKTKTADGTQFIAKSVNCGEVGSFATLSVRPERVSVGVEGENTI